MKKKLLIIIIIFLVLILLPLCIVKVPKNFIGVKYLLNKPNGFCKGDTLYFQVPLITKVTPIYNDTKSCAVFVNVVTKDGVYIELHTYIDYRIAEGELLNFYLANGTEFAGDIIKPIVNESYQEVFKFYNRAELPYKHSEIDAMCIEQLFNNTPNDIIIEKVQWSIFE